MISKVDLILHIHKKREDISLYIVWGVQKTHNLNKEYHTDSGS